jgi:hypothetical protein
MKTTLRRLALIVSFVVASALTASAEIIPFDLLGKAGPGLLPGNENVTVNGTPGTGGEIGSGIFFDNVSLQLTINIGWGSANGFTDLNENASAGHIHGPTTSGGTASFTQNASVAISLNTLAGWNPSATAGGFSGTLALTSAQAAQLMNGQFYINIHTPNVNPGGEIRGNLVAVPEPGTFVSVLLGVGALALLRRWKNA